MSDHRLSSSRRTIRASADARPVKVSAKEIEAAWWALQARRPEQYGRQTRNPRWRLNPV